MTSFTCDSCGKAVQLDDKVCPHCGRTFDAVRCPRCGHQGPESTFQNGCPKCRSLSPASAIRPRAAKSRKAHQGFLALMVVFFVVMLLVGIVALALRPL